MAGSGLNMKPVAAVIAQHVEEAAHLRQVRRVLVRAPHVRMLQLGRLDERIAAHLDGIAVAGSYGSALCQQALESPGVGSLFVATVGALEDRDAARLDALLAATQVLPEGRAGLLSAFGWVSAGTLRGVSGALLAASDPWRREVGLAACDLHGVNPQKALDRAMGDGHPGLRRRALRVAGRCARSDLLGACLAALGDSDPSCSFEAARAALLLGDRRASIAALDALAGAPGELGDASVSLLLKVLDANRARAQLAGMSKDAASARALVRCIGSAGDPHFIPWLIQQMEVPRFARLAGESFSLITGLDLAYLDLDGNPPAGVEGGPAERLDDEDLAMDDDDSLPWPDPVKIGAWWQANGHRFASGGRYFMGGVPSPGHCRAVLRSGFQRQRLAAAVHLCLETPGTPLFNVAAPAWRQLRWLDAMERQSA